ncbi:hypothetical protein [Taklimakanibacter deserti]|uniref:hypothetical protein n=1 Tax=Taklimakanibacter deserti TaxID=2267839 RepID=UPI000E64F2AF
MTSEITVALQAEDDEPDVKKAAIDLLVMRGYAREAAEDLVGNASPPEPGTDAPSWVASIVSAGAADARRRLLAQHHEQGIPPFEPPPLKSES